MRESKLSWRKFEQTGDVTYYLAYKGLITPSSETLGAYREEFAGEPLTDLAKHRPETPLTSEKHHLRLTRREDFR